MAKQIIFATGNRDKMREIQKIMEDMDVEVISMKDAGVAADPEEDGTTFEENALIKAKAVAALTVGTEEYKEAIVLADDSGLEVDYLDKQPGVYSARFMGHDTSYDVKNNAILDRLKGVPKEQRTARFVCVIAAVLPGGETRVVRETMEGYIAEEISGNNGFGYDPIFYLEEFGCTSADISPEQKNEVSHRGKALRAMRKILEESLR